MILAAAPTTTVLTNCPPAVLVMDGNKGFRENVTRHLTALGCSVVAARAMNHRPAVAPDGRWQAVVLGVEKTGVDWRKIFRDVRRMADVPVLLVGVDVIEGLEAGADACLPRECSVRQLAARLQAILRRAATRQELVIDDLRIVPGLRLASLAGRELALTPGQFDLLLSLARACGRVKTRDDLYAEFRARAYGATDRSLDVQVSCLRRKLGDDPKQPRFIRTVRSAGYMFVSPGATCLRQNLSFDSRES